MRRTTSVVVDLFPHADVDPVIDVLASWYYDPRRWFGRWNQPAIGGALGAAHGGVDGRWQAQVAALSPWVPVWVHARRVARLVESTGQMATVSAQRVWDVG